MLIGVQNQVLLSDFGIATIAHGTASQSVEAMAGTIPYMAPEQIQGNPRSASDQYSLGVVVYEWLCGDRPFHVLTPTYNWLIQLFGEANVIVFEGISSKICSIQPRKCYSSRFMSASPFFPLPDGLEITSVSETAEGVLVYVTSQRSSSLCPQCAMSSSAIHSS
jgi:serine/threonine protein kinase